MNSLKDRIIELHNYKDILKSDLGYQTHKDKESFERQHRGDPWGKLAPRIIGYQSWKDLCDQITQAVSF